MKILDTFLLEGRGVVVICAPDRVLTMDDVRAGLRLVRDRDQMAWTIIGIERHCIPPRNNQNIGLLLRGECDLQMDDDIQIEETKS